MSERVPCCVCIPRKVDSSMISRMLLVTLVCIGLLPAMGCGESGPKLYRIKGTVTHNGKPVKLLLLTFTPDDEMTKAPAMGATDDNGRFEMKIGSTPGVFPGKHTISCHDPLIDMGSKTSTEPDYLAVIAKYAPGKSTMIINVEENNDNLELKMD